MTDVGSASIAVRPEAPGDLASIRRVADEAFGLDRVPLLSGLVDALRDNSHATLSLVATIDGDVVGHVLFSPFSVTAPDGEIRMFLALGPLGVAPSHQRQGVGSMLVREGLAACRSIGCGAVFLLGGPRYYGRFGFEPARIKGIEYLGKLRNPDAWQVIELIEGVLTGVRGIGRFSPEFDDYE